MSTEITAREEAVFERNGEQSRWTLSHFNHGGYLLSVATKNTHWQQHLDQAGVEACYAMFAKFIGGQS